MAAIKDIKVWRNPTKTETRVYVHTVDGREGCKYFTTTRWHKQGDIDGNLTAEEWTEAKRIAVWDGQWHTLYENQINPPTPTHPTRCPDCGGYDCGPNCNANRAMVSTPAKKQEPVQPKAIDLERRGLIEDRGEWLLENMPEF